MASTVNDDWIIISIVLFFKISINLTENAFIRVCNNYNTRFHFDNGILVCEHHIIINHPAYVWTFSRTSECAYEREIPHEKLNSNTHTRTQLTRPLFVLVCQPNKMKTTCRHEEKSEIITTHDTFLTCMDSVRPRMITQSYGRQTSCVQLFFDVETMPPMWSCFDEQKKTITLQGGAFLRFSDFLSLWRRWRTPTCTRQRAMSDEHCVLGAAGVRFCTYINSLANVGAFVWVACWSWSKIRDGFFFGDPVTVYMVYELLYCVRYWAHIFDSRQWNGEAMSAEKLHVLWEMSSDVDFSQLWNWLPNILVASQRIGMLFCTSEHIIQMDAICAGMWA